jgi:hypothetical protein
VSDPSWNQVLDSISSGNRRPWVRRPLALRGPTVVGAAPDESAARFERLAGLMVRLHSAEKQLELAPLPAGDTSWKEVRPANRKHNLRKEAVRARLELLGYSTGKDGDTLRQAVRQFQTDAELQVDGWVGWQTWEALDEFITLEPPLKLDRWYPRTKVPCPALVRATALRLRALGFEAALTDRLEELVKPLEAFEQVARELGLVAEGEVSDRQLISLIFDDELLLTVASKDREGSPILDEPLNLEEPEGDPTSRLLRRLVRNDLWLHGYEVGDLRTPTQVVPGQKSVADGLRVFWSQRGVPSDELEARSKRIDRALFQALIEEHRPTEPGEDQHEWVSRFVDENRDELSEAWKRTIPCRPVFFIWDGVKRCGSWLKRHLVGAAGKLVSLAEVVGKGVEYAKTFVWNVVRFMFQQGSRILSTVRRAIGAFLNGIQPFLDGGIQLGEGEERIECQLGLDMDVKLLVGSRTPEARSREMAARLRMMARCLGAGTTVLGELLRAEAAILKGPGGWMAFLAHLVQRAPIWEKYVEHLASLPYLERSETPANWPRRLAIAAGVLLPVAATGVVTWKAFVDGVQGLESWLTAAGIPVGIGMLGVVLGWFARRWLGDRLRSLLPG